MKCSKCCGEIPDTSKQCPICGKLVITVEEYDKVIEKGSTIDSASPIINQKFSLDLLDKDKEQIKEMEMKAQEKEEVNTINPLEIGIFEDEKEDGAFYDEDSLTGIADLWQNLCYNLNRLLNGVIEWLIYKVPFVIDGIDVLIMPFFIILLVIYFLKGFYILRDGFAIMNYILLLFTGCAVSFAIVEAAALNSNFKKEYSQMKSNIEFHYKTVFVICLVQQILKIPLTLISIKGGQFMYVFNLIMSPIFLPLASCVVLYRFFEGKDFFSFSKSISFFTIIIYVLIIIMIYRKTGINPFSTDFMKNIKENTSSIEDIGNVILYYGFLT